MFNLPLSAGNSIANFLQVSLDLTMCIQIPELTRADFVQRPAVLKTLKIL